MTSKATALPWKKILMCASVALANYFSLAVVYPFLPFMVSDFFPLLPPSELGSRTGFLGASFNVGQLIGSLVWGRLSDRYGRRPIMLAGCLGTIVCVSGFMFSVNFYMALAMRFLWGLSNGNIGVCKTYLSEICDDSNQARGFAYFEALGGIGWLAGPAIGGILSQPTVHWPGVFPDLFDQFRYLLPCTIALCIATTSFVLAFKYLEETLHLSLAVAEDEQNETQLESLGDTKNGDDGKLLTNDAAGTAESEGPEVFMPATPAGSSFMSVLKQRNCIIACLCYAVLGLCVEMLEEGLYQFSLGHTQLSNFSVSTLDFIECAKRIWVSTRRHWVHNDGVRTSADFATVVCVSESSSSVRHVESVQGGGSVCGHRSILHAVCIDFWRLWRGG
jgi:MFS family permease